MATDADILKDANEAIRECDERERENRAIAEEDIKFARLEEQWPVKMRQQRELDGRPCLTLNKLAPVIRQVANDARQNRPQIKVQPQDSKADPETADIMSGLIRNIESSSDADVAYDTAIMDAITGGFGYFRFNLAYACDDNWEQDIVIERVANPFSIYGDPRSTAADSSDWNVAFEVDRMSKKAFQKQFKDGAEVDWSGVEFPDFWCEGDDITVAKYWTRESVSKKIYLLSNGEVVDGDALALNRELFDAMGITVEGQPREVPSHKVCCYVLNGVEVLSRTDWAGKYIPIVPVYGDEINLKGKRHFRSLIHSAIGAQQMFNYWRTTTTELVALAPRAPYIGPKGTFDADDKWATANTANHAYMEYDPKGPAPERQPFSGVPAGALQEALNASDDIKAITGIYDASLGAKSNETSGRAIMVRQREGDVSTFHFIDNLTRAIRHGGRIAIDLIQNVYTTERVVRVLGAEGEVNTVQLKTPIPQMGPDGQPQMRPVVGPDGQTITDSDGNQQMEAVTRIYDLSAGKYDLTVSAGPSFTTRREEAADQMIQFVQAFPPAAPALGDLIAKNLDWPSADEVGRRLQALLPPPIQQMENPQPPQPDPMQVQAAQHAHEMGLAQMQQQGAKDQADAQLKAAQLQLQQAEIVSNAAIANRKLDIEELKARAQLASVAHEISQPTQRPRSDQAA